jgi:hypothetical protein
MDGVEAVASVVAEVDRSIRVTGQHQPVPPHSPSRW